MHAPTDRPRQLVPRCPDRVQDLRALRVVCDRRRRRTDKQQVRVASVRDVPRERAEHTDRILELVPPRDLHHHRDVGDQRLLLQHLRPSLNASRRPVRARERRVGVHAIRQNPGGGQDRKRLLRILLRVLRREGVDRGADDRNAIARQPLPCESSSGEDEGVRAQDIATQEVPRVTSMIVGDVETDMTAPHHRRPRRAHRRRQPSRLRIVQDHDVRRMHKLRQLPRARRQRLLVHLALGVAQRPAVTGKPVQAVVDPLRDGEELRLPRDHRPACVDTRAATVTQQGAQHLDHTAALRGRVHIPDHATVQLACGLLDQAEQRLVLTRRKHRSEPLRGHRMHCLMVKCRYHAHISPHASTPAMSSVDRIPTGWPVCGFTATT